MSTPADREARRIVHNPAGKPEGWYVVSESGDHYFNDKPYKTREEALKLLEAVEANKHAHDHGRGADRDGRELRYADGVELRGTPEGACGPGMLVGYPIVHNSPSEVLKDKKSGRSFREIVRPGAASRSVREADIRALMDHDPGRVLGRNKAGTLRLVEDDRGVRAEIDLPDTTAGRDAAVSVARGDISGMSFGFRVPKGGDSWDLSGDMAVRHLHDLDVDDVSLVAYPAYPDTEAAMRSLDAAGAAAEPDPPADAPEAEPEAVADPEPGPAPDDATARELERDRDRLRMLGLP